MSRFPVTLIMLILSAPPWAFTLAEAKSRTDIQSVSMIGPSPDLRAKDPLGLDRPVVRELHVELIKKTIQKYLEGEWGYRVKAVQVNVLEPSDPIRIPPGVVELHVLPSSEEGMGRRMFRVAVTANGKPWKTIEALTDVAAMIDAVVPNRFLKAEEVVDAEDLTVSRIPIHDLRHPYITDQEDVIGKSTARPLQADTPLRPTFLKKPLMIKKGDRVMIEARRGGLSIQTSGVTKSSGQVGQTIMVANLDSGRELRAKIVAPGLVQVEF
jgi:flagella basal body P-ring formation protein FlgA